MQHKNVYTDCVETTAIACRTALEAATLAHQLRALGYPSRALQDSKGRPLVHTEADSVILDEVCS